MLQIDRQLGRKSEQALVLWLDEVGMENIAQVGGKNASLGEMIQNLSGQGIQVPMGFATTAYAYRSFIQDAGLEDRLRALFLDLDVEDMANLHYHGLQARAMVLSTPLPPKLQAAIVGAYRELSRLYGHDTDVAVRSSATAEDLPDASFAGQQETFLNVCGEQDLIVAARRCFASLFTDRAISYRQTKGFDHFSVALSIGIQKMVRSDLATSGVMFTLDPESGFRNAVLISAAYGLGENVVQGTVNPDEYVVFKPTLQSGFSPIINRRLGTKAQRLIYDLDTGDGLRNVPVALDEQQRFALSDADILQLANWGCLVEKHYSDLHGVDTPMDIEWAKDGLTGQLFVVQARPETVEAHKSKNQLRNYLLQERGEILLTGQSIGSAIGQGKVHILKSAADLEQFQAGEVLVTERTDPDWEPIMKKASAIVTNQGGRTCHAAIIARELGIPAIVGCENATEVLKTGQPVTVSCSEGEEGTIYKGLLPFKVEELQLESIPQTRTQILLNIGNPSEAFHLAALPSDGVGLARMEFIIANQIQIHPLALVHFERLPDGRARKTIGAMTQHYPNKTDYFVEKLSQGVGTIAAAFYPRPVIIRLSDFKSNEYSSLLGGEYFEPKEENPMIGWRGASRYYDPRYQEGFALECAALKKVREEMGLTNLILMVPFCRTPAEGKRVLEEMASHGLVRGENGLQVYVMCELPSNVILADRFAEIFDGFSIGSNDLTQLTLGVDRDSAAVAMLFDERDEAVQRMLAHAIQTAKAKGRKIGICGQAPSDYPEVAAFLVDQGIDSISLNPDVLLKTLIDIAGFEASSAQSRTSKLGISLDGFGGTL
jgi:pyruvate, water dikinase